MEPEIAVVKENEITIKFHPDKQVCVIEFKPTEFKTWDFVLGVLEMAKLAAIQKRDQSMMAAMMQQQAQAQAAQRQAQIIRNLHG